MPALKVYYLFIYLFRIYTTFSSIHLLKFLEAAIKPIKSKHLTGKITNVTGNPRQGGQVRTGHEYVKERRNVKHKSCTVNVAVICSHLRTTASKKGSL
jgi:hypothetical protein